MRQPSIDDLVTLVYEHIGAVTVTLVNKSLHHSIEQYVASCEMMYPCLFNGSNRGSSAGNRQSETIYQMDSNLLFSCPGEGLTVKPFPMLTVPISTTPI